MGARATPTELGVDPDRIVVAGESGGGNLTLATGMKLLRDGDLGLIRGLYAMCPYIAGEWPQDRFPSSTENNGIFLDLHNNRGRMGYGIEAFEAARSARVAVVRNRSRRRGLVPTVISVNECDPLRDEGIEFYRLLMRAGVPARCRQVMGTIHGAELAGVCPEISEETAASIAQLLPNGLRWCSAARRPAEMREHDGRRGRPGPPRRHRCSRNVRPTPTIRWSTRSASRARILRRSARERIDVRVAVGLGVAWFVLPEIAVALEPTAQHPDPTIGVVLGYVMNVIFIAMLIGLALRRRWGLVASLGGAMLVTAMAVACPTSGHHRFGLWWLGQMVCVVALVVGSVWALRRPVEAEPQRS